MHISINCHLLTPRSTMTAAHEVSAERTNQHCGKAATILRYRFKSIDLMSPFLERK